MQYNKDAWIAAYKKAVDDLKTDKPASGLPCAIATLRYVRDGILADHTKHEPGKPAKLVAMTPDSVKEAINELIKKLSADKSVDDGFASNASAAAKAAGFKGESAALAALVE